MLVVPGYGPLPSPVMIVGEAPGRVEADVGRPFQGRSGEEQEAILRRHSLFVRTMYLTNVCKEYLPGDPDPSISQLAYWTPELLAEIERCRPRLIIAVGRFAARWFLGDEADMQTVHGMPYRAGAFDSSRADRAPEGCTVVPVYHPAFGLREPSMRGLVHYDYGRAAAVLEEIRAGRPVQYVQDTLEGQEVYLDVSGTELRGLLTADDGIVALDTEGVPGDEWSLQASDREGYGYLLRTERDDFHIGVAHLQSLADRGVSFGGHFLYMYDYEMCGGRPAEIARQLPGAVGMGLDLYPTMNGWDTAYMAYLLVFEPQGLKPLARRRCGMQMVSHEETVGVLGTRLQLDYLRRVVEVAGTWPKQDARVIYENDGTVKAYTPQRIAVTAANILRDVESGKLNKDGDPTDPWKRWRDTDRVQRRMVERAGLGPMPQGSMRELAKVDFEKAVQYSCKDADSPIRLLPGLMADLERVE